MNKTITLIFIVALGVLAGCQTQVDDEGNPSQSEGQSCQYDDPQKSYSGKSQDECSRMKFMCIEGTEYFADSCGCGCQTKEEKNPTDGKLKVTDCLPDQRGAEICTMDYRPVCGWNDPAKIQCIAYPCASTFGNSCQACANENVISWSEGECPKTGGSQSY